MKKIILGLLLIFNLAANAQINSKRIRIGSLKVDENEVASIIKYEDHYLFKFIVDDLNKSIEFDINDFDKLYQVFTKENDFGNKSDNYSFSLPVTYLGDNTPKLLILYSSNNEKVTPEFHYYNKNRNKSAEEKRLEALNPNDCSNCYTVIPNFSKEEWKQIFGK